MTGDAINITTEEEKIIFKIEKGEASKQLSEIINETVSDTVTA